MNRSTVTINTNSMPQNIWANYDVEQVKIGLRKSAGILSGINKKKLLKDLTNQRIQKIKYS